MTAILCAMSEEIKPILNKLPHYETVQYVKNTFYLSQINNHDVIIAYSKIGKVFAATTATIMIEKFKAKCLIFSGIAGAIKNGLKIGNLVFATKTCQHDVDITSFGHPHGFIPESQVYFDVNKHLSHIAKKTAQKLGISFTSGIVATGDQFICDEIRKDFIKKTFKAIALEMEGGAVAVVCDTMNVPFFMLRSISDTAQKGAAVDFGAFLKKTTATQADFLYEMIKELP